MTTNRSASSEVPLELSLAEFLSQQNTEARLAGLIQDLAGCAIEIGDIISLGSLNGGSSGVADTSNVHDEVQKELDLVANDLLISQLDQRDYLAGTASEEMPDFRPNPASVKRGPYLLIFDPLDGSSNVDVNVSIGTIFSVLKAPDGVQQLAVSDFLQPGSEQVCAGYFIYGPATQLMITTGEGVHGFTLHRSRAEFLLSHTNIMIPESTCEFAINAAYRRFWSPQITQYVDDCLAGETGPRKKNFNTRWVASLVAEVHRILSRGGVFLYPADNRPGKQAGHLRILYEASPMAMLIEQAGGSATNGQRPILELQPDELHQRTPLILGAKEEVDLITA